MRSKVTTSDIENLQYISIYNHMSDKQAIKVLSMGSVFQYKARNEIIREKGEENNVYFIFSGNVKITKTNRDGREVTLAVLNDTEFFGELSAIDCQPRAATVTALVDTRVFILKGEAFVKILHDEVGVASRLISELATRIRRTDEQINSFWLNGSANRVASALARLAEDIGIRKKADVEIKRLITQKNIASYAATTRETCSRILSMFEREGFLKKDHGSITIINFERFKRQFVS